MPDPLVLDGKIWVESEVGSGSSFIFDLDLKEVESSLADKSSEEKPLSVDYSKSLDGSTILLAEDNQINQEIILGLLEKSGIKVDVANNGQEAVAMFRENSYDLILMDIQMPIIDGYEATKIVRETDRDIPIIALTANAMKKDVEKTKKAGMNEHLNKPVDVKKLYEALFQYIFQKSSINTKLGLSHLGGNEKLYVKILCELYDNYKDLKLENLDDKSLKIELHTIKGLSGNIGATYLQEIAKELETTLDRELFSDFYKELNRVLDEVKKKLSSSRSRENGSNRQVLDDKKRDEFLGKLKEFALKRRQKQCNMILDEIGEYTLNKSDEELFSKINGLIQNRKYKEIMEQF